MTEKNIAFLALIVAILALAVSTFNYFMQKSQYEIDYQEEVIVNLKNWPHKYIKQEPSHELIFSLRNTSKKNINYFFRINGNGVCVREKKQLEPFDACNYESDIHTLSKPEAGAHIKEHTVYIETLVDRSKINPLAYRSDPVFYINIEVLSAKTGKNLFHSKCYYTYNMEINQLMFYNPVLDTSGYSKVLHSTCLRVAPENVVPY